MSRHHAARQKLSSLTARNEPQTSVGKSLSSALEGFVCVQEDLFPNVCSSAERHTTLPLFCPVTAAQGEEKHLANLRSHAHHVKHETGLYLGRPKGGTMFRRLKDTHCSESAETPVQMCTCSVTHLCCSADVEGGFHTRRKGRRNYSQRLQHGRIHFH